MNIKFTILERELVGIGIHRTTYETGIEAESNPAIAMLLDQIRDGVYMNLGIRGEAAEKDDAFCMTLTLPMTSSLGVRVPGSKYMLVIMDRNSVTRLPNSFRLQGIGD